MLRRSLYALGAVMLLWLLLFAIVMTRGYALFFLLALGLTVWVGWIGWGFGTRE